MHGIGIAMPGFIGLRVKIDGKPWSFLLRRADFSPDDSFAAFHNAPVRARQVAEYLPNWKKLDWVRVPENVITRSESRAQDLPYQVNVLAEFASTLTHEEVVRAFLRFMDQVAA